MDNKHCLVLFSFLLILFNFIPNTQQEFFTAMVEMEKLLNTEERIVKSLDDYLKLEEERLGKLRRLQEGYQQVQSIASQDVKSYLANPVNAFILLKRLTVDWKNVESLLVSGPAETAKAILYNLTSADQQETFPSTEDLNGAVDALLRLQDTYKLDTSAIARGKIPLQSNFVKEPKYSNQFELTAGDCFELGRHSYVNGDYYHTVLWMQQALDLLDDEQSKTADRAEILEYLAFAMYQQGNVRQALVLTNELLELEPDHPRAPGNVKYYEQYLHTTARSKKRGDEGDDVPIDEHITEAVVEPEEPKEKTQIEIYESLCRGEKMLSPRKEAELKCYYLDVSKTPYLRLTRIKVEEAFKKPYLVLFHDVITDSELEVVKELAAPRLQRATVQNYKTGDLEVASYRISKSAWLKKEDHEIVARLNQRIEYITGLTTQTAEELQVVNYGIGGHYEPHYDFARREEKNAFKNLGTGNRIATWLNYMSDVEAGGATVFPILGVTLWPRKGSAAFWYNLHRNGEGDLLTRHAACPVLIGSKWVSNVWFHERGQEFRRPCGLKINS